MRRLLSNAKRKYLYFRRSKYFKDIESLISNRPSIISNNCFAGRIYQDFNLPYNSPTAGLYMFYPDYINFLLNLEDNLKGKLEFVRKSKYELGNKRIDESKHFYPIAILNGTIEIHFLHYKSEKEAESKWYRRANRVDFNNIVIFGAELDLCRSDDISIFDKLDFENKFFFTAKEYDYNSCLQIREFKSKGVVGDPYRYGHLFYRAISKKLRDE